MCPTETPQHSSLRTGWRCPKEQPSAPPQAHGGSSRHPGRRDALTSATLRTRSRKASSTSQFSSSFPVPLFHFFAAKSCTASLPRFGAKAHGLFSTCQSRGRQSHRHCPPPTPQSAQFKDATTDLMLLSWEGLGAGGGGGNLPEATCSSTVPTRGDVGAPRAAPGCHIWSWTRSAPTLQPRGKRASAPPPPPSMTLQNTDFSHILRFTAPAKGSCRVPVAVGVPPWGAGVAGRAPLPAPCLPPACYTSQTQSRSGCFSDNQRSPTFFSGRKIS